MEQRNLTENNNSETAFETFGKYLFLKRLATGGMAEVFLARPANHVGNGRVQVVKRILPHVANNPIFLNMFKTEIQVIMGFNHPHTVQLHDAGEFNLQPYIAMEYIEGKNLKELISKSIDRKKDIPIPTVLSLIAQAASGLNYAHTFVNKVTGESVNAIHRDISPHNLILSYDGNLKVIDFGIAKAADGVMQEQTRVGTLKGKTAYLSPEQVKGQPVDARSDVFALGIVLWELLTLKRPFTKDGDSDVNIIARIDNCEQFVVPPSEYNKDIPKEVDDIVLKALRKNPDARFSSASEFQMALRQAMQKYFPNYSYADTGVLLKSLFAEEIAQERSELKKLNMLAQECLSNNIDARTVVLETQNKPSFARTSTSISTSGKSSVGNVTQTGSEHVDFRLTKIESMIKEKASARHYMLFAFYVFSLIALKVDSNSFFSFLFPTQAAYAAAATEATAAETNVPVVEAPPKRPQLVASKTSHRQVQSVAAPKSKKHTVSNKKIAKRKK